MNNNENGQVSPSMKISSQWKKTLFTLFISVMGVQPIDIFETEGKVSLLIEKEDFYKVKKVGLHKLRPISNKIGRDIEIVVFSTDLEECVDNLFRPAEIERIKKEKQEDKEILKVFVAPWDKGRALGRKSYKLRRARAFLKRHYDISNVRIV